MRCARSPTRTGVPVIYKSSYDKANRTSASAARGIGMDAGLTILSDVREATGLPVLTDVHAPIIARRRRRRWTFCRSRPSCAARPTCCWPPAKPAARSM